MLRSKILSNILGSILGILGSLIAGVLVAIFTGIILTDGLIFIMAITSSAAFAKWFSEKVSSEFLARLRPSITEKLREVFSHDRVKITESFKTTVLKGIVEEIMERCQKSLQKQLDAFNQRVEETLTLKSISLEEQERIGALAKKVREEQIIPSQKEIETFSKDLSKYFG
jgi:hypothetical protein